MRVFTTILLLAAGVALSGCASADRLAGAEAIAAPAGLARERIIAGPFALTAFVRIADPQAPVNIYIEGDGLAWLTPTQPSPDPTPRSALALGLAALDPAANTAYLARPCQFTPMAENPACQTRYWTGARFSPEVVAAMATAVDRIAARTVGHGVNLVGYSGGGAVATLVAATRAENLSVARILSLRTVAGNLDHGGINRLHHVSPMPASLNPVDFAAGMGNIPQIHFSGGDDRVVPPAIAETFRRAVPAGCVMTATIAGASHEKGWLEQWRSLLRQTPECR